MPDKTTSVAPTLTTLAAAKQQFDLNQYDPFGRMGFQKVIFLDGNAYINEDLTQDWAERTLETLGASPNAADTLILVNGNLTVAGIIKPSDGSFPFLLVLGNVTCDVLYSGDECIRITGDAYIKYAFDGNYNDGSINIDGITRVPYVLNSNHDSVLRPEGAILINYFGDEDDFFAYDYTEQDFERVMVPAVFDENEEFSRSNFIALLQAGKSPLKEGALPARLVVLEELAQLVNSNTDIRELDFTDKKLKEFPRALTKITSLRNLILDENPIGSIPEDIKDLVNLEELHLEECSLETLDAGIGSLKQLKVLNVAHNEELQLPESINDLSSLRDLNISYNTGFGLPASVAGLKNLEELCCYGCTDDAPADFPILITQLTGLKRLLFKKNPIKEIPESILNLEQLEELDLNSSLCYLDELPDLSQLKKLKTLHANGLSTNTTYPSPKQSLLGSFFKIASLETLNIDRHGERKERKGIVREALKPEQLEGISNLVNLKVLDLSFNHLASLPEEIFALKNLQFLNLRYNRLSTAERLRISKNLPGCTIDFRDNNPENDTADTKDVKEWQAMNKLMMKANDLMYAKGDREKLLQSLVEYDKVLDFFSSGKVVDEYNLLYANYGKVYAYSYLTSNHKATFSPAELLEMNQAAIKQGLHTLSLIPAVIWHFTDLGRFHEEITRITANAVAWQMHVVSDKQEDLEKALEIILKGVAFIEEESHYFIYDTQVRVLLKLGRTADAYQLVKRTLKQLPDFNDFQDLKEDPDYQAWLEKSR